MGLRKDKRFFADPYAWSDTAVSKILARREYLGHVVNFKTYRKSYKHTKTIFNAPSDHLVFENKHEAIIDAETFDRVQKLLVSKKRRHTKSGRVNLFLGLVVCADCKSTMSLACGSSFKPEQDFYSCRGFCAKKKTCDSSHYIRRELLEQKVLEHIQNVTAFVANHEDELVRRLEALNATRVQKDLASDKKALAQSEKRIEELDKIIQQLFEKNATGVLSDERFIKLSQGYEVEQKELEAEGQTLRSQLAEQQENRLNVGAFLAQVRKYTRITELTPLILNELVERIEIHSRQYKSRKAQKIDVHFNYVGRLELSPESQTLLYSPDVILAE